MRVLDKPSTRTNIEIPFPANDYSSAQPTTAFTPVYVPPTVEQGEIKETRFFPKIPFSMLDRIVYRSNNCNIIIVSFRIWRDLEEEIKLRSILRLSGIRYFSIWLSLLHSKESFFRIIRTKPMLYILYVKDWLIKCTVYSRNWMI